MTQNLQEQLKLGLEHTLQKSQTPGATVAVHINGQPFLERGVGYQDLEHEISLPTDANFYIYSITKSLQDTAAFARGLIFYSCFISIFVL